MAATGTARGAGVTLTSNPLDVLLAYDAWATRTMLERCRVLSHEQFHRRFEIGLGSLHENFSHIVGVVRRWTDRLTGRPLRAALNSFPGRPDIAVDGGDRSPDQLLALHEEAAADLVVVTRGLVEDGLEKTLVVQWPGEDGKPVTYTFTRGAVLTHIVVHGTHHRAQCINMMRHLNVPGLSDDLPDPGVVDWQSAVEMPGVR